MEQEYTKYFDEIEKLKREAGDNRALITLLIEDLEKNRDMRSEYVQKCDELIGELKKKIQPNPARQQLEADARAYDEANGQGEIDVSKLPF